MQAHLDGKEIEYSCGSHGKYGWYPLLDVESRGPFWNWEEYDYRIKPELKKGPIRHDELPYVFVLKYPNGKEYACQREFFYGSIEYAIQNGGMWTADGKTYHSFEVEE
jgi:hypothetical protein